MAEIPAVTQLLNLIAQDLIEKPNALTGDEVRFLRKRLGRKAKDFAKEIGIEPETLSRIENGHFPVSQQTDMLVRFDYILSADSKLVERRRSALMDILRSWKEQTAEPSKIIATVSNNEWQAENMAA